MSIENAVNTVQTTPADAFDGQAGMEDIDALLTQVLSINADANEKGLQLRLNEMKVDQTKMDAANKRMAEIRSDQAGVSPEDQQSESYRQGTAELETLKADTDSMASISQRQLIDVNQWLNRMSQAQSLESAMLKKVNDTKDGIIQKVG